MTNSVDPDQLASSELFARPGFIRVQQDKGLGEWIHSGSFFTMLYKEDMFGDFLFTLLHAKPLLERGIIAIEKRGKGTGGGGIHITFFLFLHENICFFWYILEAPRRGGSSECPQHMFCGEIRQISIFFGLKGAL